MPENLIIEIRVMISSGSRLKHQGREHKIRRTRGVPSQPPDCSLQTLKECPVSACSEQKKKISCITPPDSGRVHNRMALQRF
jgi:hypothetical protein